MADTVMKQPMVKQEPKHPPVLLPHVLREPLQGFVDFIREQGVVSLAVGLVLGVASKSVVDSLVNNIFNPIIGVLIGGENLSNKAICLKSEAGKCVSSLGYGHVLSDFLSFLIVAALVYFAVKGLKLDRLEKKKAAQVEEAAK